jgi:hypothetical protein
MKTLRKRVKELEAQSERGRLAFDEKLEELSGGLETVKGTRRKPLAPYLLIAEHAGAHW